MTTVGLKLAQLYPFSNYIVKLLLISKFRNIEMSFRNFDIYYRHIF